MQVHTLDYWIESQVIQWLKKLVHIWQNFSCKANCGPDNKARPVGISDNKGKYHDLVCTKYQNITLTYWFNMAFTILTLKEPVFVLVVLDRRITTNRPPEGFKLLPIASNRTKTMSLCILHSHLTPPLEGPLQYPRHLLNIYGVPPPGAHELWGWLLINRREDARRFIET